ncbi:MAG: SRPBCC family protein [Myxococcota bacterium]|nr:SRPBCC family protein [Myxococcota bacterium]
MALAKTKLETFVSPDELKEVLLDFESYAELLPEVSSVDVKERSDDAALVTFHVDISFAGFDVKTEYTCRYAISDREIAWELVDSPSLTKNVGKWVLEETEDEETVAHYESEVETNLPIPPEVQALFVEESLPKLMERFRDKAEDL